MTPEATFRWIDGQTASPADWDRIEGILAARGWMSLNRITSRILVAESSVGGLLGFICLQMVPHTEPLFVAPSMYATGLAEELANRMLDFMTEVRARGWMVVAENPHAAKLCEDRGMKRVEVPVYVTVGMERV